MPISEKFFEEFKKKHNLDGSSALSYAIKSAPSGDIISQAWLMTTAPMAAKCGLGRVLAERLAQEKGCYVEDSYFYGLIFVIICKEENDL